jgi:threonyl-tRNA synthetase
MTQWFFIENSRCESHPWLNCQLACDSSTHYAQPIAAELRANRVRVDADFSAMPFEAKIADAEKTRVHTMLVIGGRGMETGQVSVRLHHGGPQGAKPKAEVVADILAGIKARRA